MFSRPACAEKIKVFVLKELSKGIWKVLIANSRLCTSFSPLILPARCGINRFGAPKTPERRDRRMEEIKLEAQVREELGKRPVRRLRKSGYIPAVVYGPAQEPLPVKLRESLVERVFHHITETTPIKLVITGDGEEKNLRVFLKMVQRDKVTDKIVHLDFYVPVKGHKMHINIPIEYKGKPIGVERGGMLEILVEELPAEVDPDKIVEKIEIDISGLGLGESLHVKDVELSEGIKAMLDDEEVLAVVIAPRKAVEEEVEEEEAAAEEEEEVQPEVIKKGKEKEEEE